MTKLDRLIELIEKSREVCQCGMCSGYISLSVKEQKELETLKAELEKALEPKQLSNWKEIFEKIENIFGNHVFGELLDIEWKQIEPQLKELFEQTMLTTQKTIEELKESKRRDDIVIFNLHDKIKELEQKQTKIQELIKNYQGQPVGMVYKLWDEIYKILQEKESQ